MWVAPSAKQLRTMQPKLVSPRDRGWGINIHPPLGRVKTLHQDCSKSVFVVQGPQLLYVIHSQAVALQVLAIAKVGTDLKGGADVGAFDAWAEGQAPQQATKPPIKKILL